MAGGGGDWDELHQLYTAAASVLLVLPYNTPLTVPTCRMKFAKSYVLLLDGRCDAAGGRLGVGGMGLVIARAPHRTALLLLVQANTSLTVCVKRCINPYLVEECSLQQLVCPVLDALSLPWPQQQVHPAHVCGAQQLLKHHTADIT